MSSHQSLCIRGGRLIDPSVPLEAEADILIEQGRIIRIGQGICPSEHARVVDAAQCWILPGMTDLHTTLSEPGFEHRESMRELCETALAGGFTQLVLAPTSHPPIDHAGMVRSLVLCAPPTRPAIAALASLTLSNGGQRLAELGELADSGAVGFSDAGCRIDRTDLLRSALEYIRPLGVRLFLRCEESSLAQNGVMHEGVISTRLGLRGVPGAAEELDVYRAITLARLTGSRVHIHQLSAATSLELVRRAKLDGVAITCDVSPHHLWFTDERVRGFTTSARVSPPLRSENDRQALIQGLNDGTINAVASGHTPLSTLEKEPEFEHAHPGVSSLETVLPAMLTLISCGILERDRVVMALTHGANRVVGIPEWPLAVGSPANLQIISPLESWSVNPGEFRTPARSSLFEGIELTGRVRCVVADGRLVWPPSVLAEAP